jgi:NAD(P)-dependent dehydrogenase (short-subunit alcohol dehydrogenase family)
LRLKDKVAVVTGAGMGIGEAIALRYAHEGAKVVVAEVNSAAGNAVVDAILHDGGEAMFAQTDISAESQVKALVASTLARFGRIDILVNNAAVLLAQAESRAHEISNEEWDRTIEVNLKGHWLCAKYVIPMMLGQRSGNILFVTSRTALRGFPGLAAYSASKAGALALMRSMAADYAADGIRVNAIVPGTMDTPMNAERLANPAARQKYLSKIPSGRLGLADDIAGMATFLATEEAKFCIGGLYFVDGGADLG